MIRTRLLVVLVVIVTAAAVAYGQGDRWYPSRWGAADQRGAANRITPAKVLEAKNAIQKGQIYQLGHVYESGMPTYGTRHYSIRIPQAFSMPGKNQAVYHDEVISGELGQVGTQFDGLGHLGIGDLFYNGNRRSEFAQAEGLTKLGVENVGAIVTRGVLIDLAKFKGVAQLPGTYEITVADLKCALQKQNVKIRSGDVVLIHTGWSSLWMTDNTKYGATEPGIGVAAAQFLAVTGRPLAPGLATQDVDLVLPGAIYGDRINVVDMRLAKVLRFGRYRANVGMDVYNLLNANTPTTYETVYDPATNGARWMQPTAVLLARFMRFNVQVDF